MQFPTALLLAALFACKEKEGDTGEPPTVLDAIDRDGDGTLTTDDLEQDEAAAWFSIADAEGQTAEEALVTTMTELYQGDSGAWYLRMIFDGDGRWELTLRFTNSTDLSEMTGELEHASLRNAESGFFAFREGTGASLVVSNVNDYRATGSVSGPVEMDVIDVETEEPTGGVATLHAAAFRAVFFGEPS